jgi:hypothetical protein
MPLATVLFVAASVVTGAAQEATSTPDKFVAFRVTEPMTPDECHSLLLNATKAGLTPVEDRALQRAGLLVFELPEDPALVEKSGKIFSGMRRVPVREFRGVLSVHTGNFYLRFKDHITLAAARKRVADLGFKVVTPESDRSSLLVVRGTGLPTDRDRELTRLKTLQDLLYVAPDDIPLHIPASPAK